jgi:hypothetical protein
MKASVGFARGMTGHTLTAFLGGEMTASQLKSLRESREETGSQACLVALH